MRVVVLIASFRRLRRAVQNLIALSSLPASDALDERRAGQYSEAIEALPAKATAEEAVALLDVFPPDSRRPDRFTANDALTRSTYAGLVHVLRAAMLVSVVGVSAGAALAGVPTPPLADTLHPRWFADGSRVGVESNIGSKVYRWDPYVIESETGAMRPAQLHEFPPRPPLLGPVPSPDGTGTARIEADRLILTASRGTSRDLGKARGFRWLPDGSLLVATRDERYLGAALALVDPATASRATVVQDVALEGGFDVSPDGRRIAFVIMAGGPSWGGHVVYEASFAGPNVGLRRLSPTACAEPPIVLSWHCYLGTDGPDRLVGTKRRDQVLAGAGDDRIRGGDGFNRLEGWWGDDDIASGSGNDVVLGGAGRDWIRTGGGWDVVVPGPGADRVASGRQRDMVDTADGERDLVDCGPGRDSVRVDPLDRLIGCELVRRL